MPHNSILVPPYVNVKSLSEAVYSTAPSLITATSAVILQFNPYFQNRYTFMTYINGMYHNATGVQ